MKLEQIAELSLPERAALTAGRDMWSTVAFPTVSVSSLKMADGPMGIASGRVDERDISVLTPCSLALGATWDRDLVARVAALVASEASRRGVSVVLGPNLNLARSPLAGRTFEMFSEDPLLTGLVGTAWIEGLQAQGVGAVAKHLVCNDSETLRHFMNSVVDERALREVYLLPFEMAAKARCAGMMTAYNRVNGIFCVEHPELITRIVKQEWGFEGFTVSDWFGTLHTFESAQAGLDLEMPGPGRFFGTPLADWVTVGKIPEQRLNDAAQRVAVAAERFSSSKAHRIDAQDAQELLCEAAAAGFVLLKNKDALLPLSPQHQERIAVIGPNARLPCYQGGTFAKIAVDPASLTPLQALREQFAHVDYEPGVSPEPRLPSLPATPARDLGDSKTRGVTVDYFDSHDFNGLPIASETRDTNSLTWFAGLPDNLIVIDKPAGIRIEGIFTPEFSGSYTFLAGGTGSVRLSLDGKLVVDHELVVLAKDVMGMLKGGDAETASIDLVAGRPVAVCIEFRYTPARAQGIWFGVHAPNRAQAMLAEAEAIALEADTVLLFVGETADASVESKDRDTTSLPATQVELIERICKANPRTIVIVNAAHAVDLSWQQEAAAVLLVWYPGEQFGRALAEVVAGTREPGGRLPISLATHEEDYPAFDTTPDAAGDLHYAESWKVGYRGFAQHGLEPLHCLGAGIGYATFTYGNPSYEAPTDTVQVEVTNISLVAGKEIVQVYTRDGVTPLLAGFASVTLGAGQTSIVSVVLNREIFREWDATAQAWRLSPARTGLWVGHSLCTAQLRLTR